MRRSTLLFPALALLGLTALTAAPQVARGDGGGGAGGGTTTAGTGGGTSSTAGTGGSASTAGTGGGPVCVDDTLCDTPSEDCSCADCAPLALCHPGQCVTDGVCDLKDACICSDCHLNPFCSDVSHCVDDGACDAFNEGCVCADCAAKSECAGASGSSSASSSTTSSSGSGGSGGDGSTNSGFVPSEEPTGCSLGRAAGATVPALGLLLGLSALALAARRKRA